MLVAVPGDEVLGWLDAAAAEGEHAVHRQVLADPVGVGVDHGLRIGVAADLAHRLDDVLEALPPGAVGATEEVECFAHDVPCPFE